MFFDNSRRNMDSTQHIRNQAEVETAWFFRRTGVEEGGLDMVIVFWNDQIELPSKSKSTQWVLLCQLIGPAQ